MGPHSFYPIALSNIFLFGKSKDASLRRGEAERGDR